MTDHEPMEPTGFPDRSVQIPRLLAAFDAVGANVTAAPRREGTVPGTPRPVELSPALSFAVDLVRHFRVEGTNPKIWTEWEDTFAAYVGDEIAEHMSVYLGDPTAPLEVAVEMHLTDSAMLADPIRREIEESTTSLEYLARQRVERAMVRIVRQYYLSTNHKEEQ